MKFESSVITYQMQAIPVKIGNAQKTAKSITSTACPDCDGDCGVKNYCKECNKEWAKADLKSAIKITKDEKRIFSQDEVKKVKESDNTITVLGTFPKESLDKARINKTWYVIPDSAKGKRGKTFVKPWESLRNALEESDEMILVKVFHRNTERLAVLTANPGTLVMHGIVFYDDFNSFDAVIERPTLTEQEKSMGMSFIKQLEPAEDLELIVNESRERLLQLCDGEVEIADITEEDDMSFFAPTPNAS